MKKYNYTMARFNKNDGKIQDVLLHCKNVADYCKMFALEMGENSIKVTATAELIGRLHDMGKYSQDFQEYIKEAYQASKNKEEYRPNKKPDHGKYGALYIWKKYHHQYSTPAEKVAAEIIAFVICCHHGGLQNMVDFNDQTFFSRMVKRLADDDEYTEVETQFFYDFDRKELEELSCMAIEEIMEIRDKLKHSWLQSSSYLIKVLYSILTDADRLDSAEFEAGKKLVSPSENSEKIEELFKDYSNNLENHLNQMQTEQFESDNQMKIARLRGEISNQCKDFSNQKSGIYCLTVPTGGGKTLSCFRFAVNHALNENMNRIIYVAPYTTIIEQNASDIRDAFQCGDKLLEHHSNIFNSHVENEEDENINNSGLLAERWDAPIIFTTMVQFLESIYGKSTIKLRKFHNIANSVLIFDEIQTIPMHCIALFNLAITFLNKYCHCTVILCTATQPALDRIKKYSLEFSTPKEMISAFAEKFQAFSRMKVIDKRKEVRGKDAAVAIPLVQEILKSSERLLMIFNTKSITERVYGLVKEQFEPEYQVYCLTTNMCAAHRKILIADIKEKLQKKEKVICVSTQLIEAGVNISFEHVVRNLAGLDSVSQATGRGNRHGEQEIGYTYLINLQENLDFLPEIAHGAQITSEIMYLHQNATDLFSPKIMEEYFIRYFNEDKINEKFEFPIKTGVGESTTICNMLKSNKQRYERTRKSGLILNFMFADAEKYFYVIDQLKQSVVVPYGEGERFIADLYSKKDLGEKMKLIKKLQPYTVNLFEHDIRKLKQAEAIDHCDLDGVLVLKSGFYSIEKGMTYEKKLQPCIN